MICDCIKNTEEGLIRHFKSEAGDDVRAECGGLGINLSSGGMSLSIPYTIRGTARAFKSAKGVTISMIASFCPFCGCATKIAEAGLDNGINAAFSEGEQHG